MSIRERHQRGKLARASLETIVGERGVVGAPLLRRQAAFGAFADQPAYWQARRILAEGKPKTERQWNFSAARGQAGVRRDHGREPLGEAGDQPQTDQSAPVLAEQRDAA